MEDQRQGTRARIGLLGGGAQAREIASYLPAGVEYFFALSAGHQPPEGSRGVDLADPPLDLVELPVVGAVGAPGLRRDMVVAWPGKNFAVVQAPSAYVDADCTLAPGTVVAPHAVLSVGVQVGEHTQVNIGATLSHDVHCGAFVTIAPGVRLAGRVTVGDGAFLGIGATVVNGVALAPGVVVGAGAVVVQDVDEPNSVVVGVPARRVGINTRWLDAL